MLHLWSDSHPNASMLGQCQWSSIYWIPVNSINNNLQLDSVFYNGYHKNTQKTTLYVISCKFGLEWLFPRSVHPCYHVITSRYDLSSLRWRDELFVSSYWFCVGCRAICSSSFFIAVDYWTIHSNYLLHETKYLCHSKGMPLLHGCLVGNSCIYGIPSILRCGNIHYDYLLPSDPACEGNPSFVCIQRQCRRNWNFVVHHHYSHVSPYFCPCEELRKSNGYKARWKTGQKDFNPGHKQFDVFSCSCVYRSIMVDDSNFQQSFFNDQRNFGGFINNCLF